MADILIRDVPDRILAGIDANAARLGLSRTEYLRRQLVRDAARSQGPVSVDDLRHFASWMKDLANPEVMREAWQ